MFEQMTGSFEYDVAIIGGGSGGYAAARPIRQAHPSTLYQGLNGRMIIDGHNHVLTAGLYPGYERFIKEMTMGFFQAQGSLPIDRDPVDADTAGCHSRRRQRPFCALLPPDDSQPTKRHPSPG